MLNLLRRLSFWVLLSVLTYSASPLAPNTGDPF